MGQDTGGGSAAHDDDPAALPHEGIELPAPQPIDRRHVVMLGTPLLVLVVMTQLAGAFFPILSTQDPPLLLLILSSTNRNLAIAAAKMAFPIYATIAFIRLLAPDPFFYELGWHYGERTLSWMERRTPTFGSYLRQVERWFGKAGWLFILVMPNNYVCAIAGSVRMRRDLFWALNVVGTIGRILLFWWVGQRFQNLIESILSWIGQYRVPLLALSLVIVGLSTYREWRKGTSGVQQIMELENELEELTDDEIA